MASTESIRHRMAQINPGGAMQTAGPTPYLSTARKGGEGLVARLSPIKGTTPKKVLSHRIWLPAVLNTVTLTETALHNEYDTLSAGQFSQGAMGGPEVQSQLRDLPLDTLTLAYDAEWLVVRRQNPLRVRDTLFRIMRSRKPVHLLAYFHPSHGERVLNTEIPTARPEFNLWVTLRQGTKEIRPGEHDTHYLSFTMKEWRDPSVPAHTSRRPGGNSGRKRGVQLPTTHVLSATDTLTSLSFEYYGSHAHWRVIANANGVPKRWGQGTPLVGLGGHFKLGAKMKIPLLPSKSGGAGV